MTGWAGWRLELGHVTDLKNAALVHYFYITFGTLLTLLLWKMSSGKCIASVRASATEKFDFVLCLWLFFVKAGSDLKRALFCFGKWLLYRLLFSAVYSERLHSFWWQNAGSVCLFMCLLIFVFFYFTFLFMAGALAVMRLLPVTFLCLGFALVKQKHVQSSLFPTDTFLVGDQRDGCLQQLFNLCPCNGLF